MRIRDWQDILNDVVESDVDPDDWRALAGPRSTGVGEDLYLAHPRRGLFLLKTYPKNPFEVKGVGSRIARSLDEEIGPHLPQESTQRFAVHPGSASDSEAETRARRVTETIRAHADAPTTPDALFDDVMEALESPAYGPLQFDLRSRDESLDSLADTFDEAESMLDAELDDIVDDDGVGRGFN